MFDKTAAVIESQGFMKKVTFMPAMEDSPSSEPSEEVEVFVPDKELDIQEDREEIVSRAKEQVS